VTEKANSGNTPLHLAMESAHAEVACLLIEAGADRSRVSLCCEAAHSKNSHNITRKILTEKHQKRLKALVVRNKNEPGLMSSSGAEILSIGLFLTVVGRVQTELFVLLSYAFLRELLVCVI